MLTNYCIYYDVNLNNSVPTLYTGTNIVNTKGSTLIVSGLFYELVYALVDKVLADVINSNTTHVMVQVNSGTGGNHIVKVFLSTEDCARQLNTTWLYFY